MGHEFDELNSGIPSDVSDAADRIADEVLCGSIDVALAVQALVDAADKDWNDFSNKYHQSYIEPREMRVFEIQNEYSQKNYGLALALWKIGTPESLEGALTVLYRLERCRARRRETCYFLKDIENSIHAGKTYQEYSDSCGFYHYHWASQRDLDKYFHSNLDKIVSMVLEDKLDANVAIEIITNEAEQDYEVFSWRHRVDLANKSDPFQAYKYKCGELTVALWKIGTPESLKAAASLHSDYMATLRSENGFDWYSEYLETRNVWIYQGKTYESFLNRERTKKRYLDWTLACTIGAGIGWAFTAPIIDIGFLPIVIEGLVRGAGVGFVLGLVQWIPLRQHFGKQINQWIQFSAAGYSVGFGLGILFFQNLYDTGTPIILVEALYGVSTGIALGIAQYFAFKPLLQTSHQWLPYVPDTDGYKSAKTKLNKTIMFWIFYVLIAEVVGTAIGWGLLGRPLYSISSSFVFQGLVCGGISGLIHGAITKRMITRLFSFLD